MVWRAYFGVEEFRQYGIVQQIAARVAAQRLGTDP
jgi:hypothetical protein